MRFGAVFGDSWDIYGIMSLAADASCRTWVGARGEHAETMALLASFEADLWGASREGQSSVGGVIKSKP